MPEDSMPDQTDTTQPEKAPDMTQEQPAEQATPPPVVKKPVDISSLQRRAEAASDDIKKSLEYAILGKLVSVKVKGRKINFVKWGLARKLSLGSKVINLISRVKSFMPSGTEIDASDNTFLIQVMGYLAEDVIDIIAQSIDAKSFGTPSEAAAWIDEECDLNDLFDMCVIVYDTNFPKGEDLGKQSEGLNKLHGKIQSLLK